MERAPMLLHILKYKFLCLIRDRAIMFWAFMFPVILLLLFHLLLTNINTEAGFEEVRFAVVEEEAFNQDLGFRGFIQGMMESYEKEEATLYHITLESLDDSRRMLEADEIEGYVRAGETLSLFVNQSGGKESIIKALLDEYLQFKATLGNLREDNPEIMENLVFSTNNHVEAVPLLEGESPDFSMMIYYSFIAMSCLYASFWGLRMIHLSQGNLSSIGARMGLVPRKKMYLLALDFFTSWMVQLAIIAFQLLFMMRVLNIEGLKPLGMVFLTAAVGSAMAISLGTFIGAVIKMDEDAQVTIINSIIGIGYVVTVSQVSDIIEARVPILSYINPIKLINDALLSLYYFDHYSLILRNLGIMFLLTLFFGGITYVTVRRVRYASL